MEGEETKRTSSEKTRMSVLPHDFGRRFFTTRGVQKRGKATLRATVAGQHSEAIGSPRGRIRKELGAGGLKKNGTSKR